MISSNSEFLKLAFCSYDNPHLATISEFEYDLKRFTYLNNLLNRYRLDPIDLKDRLILNHIVIIGNCFTVPTSIPMLYYKVSDENYCSLNTFLYYLGIIEISIDKLDQYLLGILNEYQ